MSDKKTAFLVCGCSGVNHAGMLQYFPPSKADKYPALYLSLVMPYPKPWYMRLWLALKYIFLNSDCGYLGFEHVYTRAGAEAHIAILQEYVEADRKAVGE